ncbi:hypothetical protein BkAM31D_18075 [Halalkalibacter krulwichiae]|uniref:SPOR domain-containing protein n=1 Tax=Halalkalibacter krulwichiae TaxID=199441 RepID=A0A1X9MDS1_9BACI|nr:hypothetical protein BkAM31D_18075 [Halalkalibacter krulwichiae]
MSRLELYYQPENFNAQIQAGDNAFYVVQTGAFNTEYYFLRQLSNLMNDGIYPRSVVREHDPTLASLVVHTGFAHDRESAEMVNRQVSSKGESFQSWVDRIPFRLLENEQTTVLPVAIDAVTLVSKMSTAGFGRAPFDSNDQTNLSTIVANYEQAVKQAINQGTTEERKDQLEQTVTFLQLANNAINEYTRTSREEYLWQTQAAMLDFVHTLNGYERYHLK